MIETIDSNFSTFIGDWICEERLRLLPSIMLVSKWFVLDGKKISRKRKN